METPINPATGTWFSGNSRSIVLNWAKHFETTQLSETPQYYSTERNTSKLLNWAKHLETVILWNTLERCISIVLLVVSSTVIWIDILSSAAVQWNSRRNRKFVFGLCRIPYMDYHLDGVNFTSSKSFDSPNRLWALMLWAIRTVGDDYLLACIIIECV